MAPPNVTTSTEMFMATTSDSMKLTSRASVTTPTEKATPTPVKPTRVYKWDIAWVNVLAFIYLHVASLYGIYLVFTTAKLATTLFAFFFMVAGGMGITAGAHRLWAHKTYKAKWPLKLILTIFQTFAFQNHIYEWVRDHRVHHKFTDTDADPHNATRGFFFSHIGWLMVKKHKDVKEKGKTVDMSDLEEDFFIVWQRRTYWVMMPLLCFVMPTWVPVYFWDEDVWVSWFVSGILRYTISLNGTWLVNSAAHIWGMKPYDKSIGPVENLSVAVIAFGEGWHNYHHTFPWDYKTAEFSSYGLNLTTGFIDLFSKIGWAYDMKTVSAEMVRKRAHRTGDGTWHSINKAEVQKEKDDHGHEEFIWGWGDKEMLEEDINDVTILNKKE